MNKWFLYADDDADDREWVKETCSILGAQLAVSFVENGREVLNYLQTLLKEELPSLIILDLNMPKLDGRQTLRQLKSHPLYRQIPVAIVSTSSSNLDKEVCQRLGAELFLVKPNSFPEWQTIVRQLVPFAV